MLHLSKLMLNQSPQHRAGWIGVICKKKAAITAGKVAIVGAALAAFASHALAEAPSKSPEASRQQALVRVVRQDCGSCHGMRLTGGLGPALTADALTGKPVESLFSTIYGGRPGTPMAPWSAMLSASEAQWIAEQLLAGFPELPKAHP